MRQQTSAPIFEIFTRACITALMLYFIFPNANAVCSSYVGRCIGIRNIVMRHREVYYMPYGERVRTMVRDSMGSDELEIAPISEFRKNGFLHSKTTVMYHSMQLGDR